MSRDRITKIQMTADMINAKDRLLGYVGEAVHGYLLPPQATQQERNLFLADISNAVQEAWKRVAVRLNEPS